jgi:hypothetical protein
VGIRGVCHASITARLADLNNNREPSGDLTQSDPDDAKVLTGLIRTDR